MAADSDSASLSEPHPQFVRVGTCYEPGLYDLGVELLKEPLRLAAKAMIATYTPTYQAHAMAQAMVFVHGSGLEQIIHTFGIDDIDPTEFRSVFLTWTARQKKHQLLALSSATTPTGL